MGKHYIWIQSYRFVAFIIDKLVHMILKYYAVLCSLLAMRLLDIKHNV